jgi:hypothetical protein
MYTQADDDIKTKVQVEKNMKIKIEIDKHNGLTCSKNIKNQSSSAADKNEKNQFFWKFWILDRLSNFLLSGERAVSTDSFDFVTVEHLDKTEVRKKREERGETKRESSQVATEVDDATAASGPISVSPHGTSEAYGHEKERRREREIMRERAAVVKALLSDMDASHVIRPSYQHSDNNEDFSIKHADLGPDSHSNYDERGESDRSAMEEEVDRGSVEEAYRESAHVTDSAVGGYDGISIKLFSINNDKAESEKFDGNLRKGLHFSDNEVCFACLTNSLRALHTVISAVTAQHTNCDGSGRDIGSGSGSGCGSYSEGYPLSSSTPTHRGLESEFSKWNINNNSESQIFKVDQKLFGLLSVCVCSVLDTFISTFPCAFSVSANPEETRIYFDTILSRNETIKFHLSQILSILQYGCGQNLWSRICYTHRFSPLVLSFMGSVGNKGANEVVKEKVKETSAGQ